VSEELVVSSRPELERPILIAAFRGWNDGGQGASLATGYLAKLWDAKRFAEIEPENFFDFQATRPHVSLEDGVTRRIDWPSTVFYHGRPASLERDVVLLLGIEPNLRWQTFTDLVVDFIKDLGVELVVSLGALLADVPHTRPCPVTGSASDQQLVERLADLIEADIDTTELAEAAENYSEQVSEAVASDPDTAAYIEELEQRADTLAEEADLPSGDALAAELTQFLRDRERENGDDDVARGPS